MTQKTIVFDFGGVLFNTSAADFYHDRFQEHGRTEEELSYFLQSVFTRQERSAANIGTMHDVITQKVKQHPDWAGDIRAFGADQDFLKQIRGVIPGMQDVLDDIAQNGDSIVGLTNWASDTYDVLPAAFPNVLEHFSKVVVSGKVGLKKPSLEIFKLAQYEFGNPDVSNVYYFDDKSENVEAAKRAVGWNAFVFENADTVRHALALSPKVG